MNEQEVADFFSEQVDRMLGGQMPGILPEEGTLQELLTLAEQLAQVEFQASPAGQAAFQNRLATWFSPTQGRATSEPKSRRWDKMSGKLFALIVSILVTIVTTVATIVIAIVVVVRGVLPGVTPATPIQSPPLIPSVTAPVSPTSPSATETPSVTISPSLTPTVVPTGVSTPTLTPPPTLPGTADAVETITVIVTIEIEVDDLIPGLPPLDDDHDDGGSGDHNRGHGNDPDHHDEDNPGRDH